MNEQDRAAFERIRAEHVRRALVDQCGKGLVAGSFESGWLAALAYARKQQAELVEAVERYNRCPLDAHDRPESWDAIADIQAAAAKLKEQDDG